MNANDAILADEKHFQLFEELLTLPGLTFSAGGAGQNTARAGQWLLPAGTTVYIGCVGKDENGRILREAAEGDGLVVEYMEDDGLPSGVCAVLSTDGGKNRSLVANLGAANNYRVEHLLQAALQEHVQRANLIYITGFFLTVSPDTIIHLAEIAHEHGKQLAMNLSAPFISQAYKDPLLHVLPYVDILFGNEAEALAFAHANNIEMEDPAEIAKHLAGWPRKTLTRSRTVIITQGPNPTILSTSDDLILISTPPIAKEDILDTNGAGDAFVGGFLAEYILGRSIEECIQMGQRLAGFVIRQLGVNFPKERPESLSTCRM